MTAKTRLSLLFWKSLIAGFSMVTVAMASQAPSPDDPQVRIREVDEKTPVGAWIRAKTEETRQAFSGPLYDSLAKDYGELLSSGAFATQPQVQGKYAYQYALKNPADRTSAIWRRTPLASYGENWETVIDYQALGLLPAFDQAGNTIFPSCLGDRCLMPLADPARQTASFREFDLGSRRFVDAGLDIIDFHRTFEFDARWVDADTWAFVADTEGAPDSLTSAGKMPRAVRLKRRNQTATVIHTIPADHLYQQIDVLQGGASPIILIRQHIVQTRHIYVAVDSRTLIKKTFELPESLDYQGFFQGHLMAMVFEPWQVGNEEVRPGALVAIPLADLLSTGAATQVSTLWAPVPRAPGSAFNRTVFDHVNVTSDSIFVSMLDNVQGKFLRIDPVRTPTLNGQVSWKKSEVVFPGLPSGVRGQSFIMGMGAGIEPVYGLNNSNENLLVEYSDYLTPKTLLLVSRQGARQVHKDEALFDSSRMVAEQRRATSADGTEVPYFVLRSKHTRLDGSSPTILYGYGCTNMKEVPAYQPTFGKLWVERGGVYVVATIRGGGEFGPAWYAAGDKTHKQKSLDDFTAVARSLISSGFTSPEHLGIKGVSCGGLLVSAVSTQHPELFSAVKSEVGPHDVSGFLGFNQGEGLIDLFGDPRLPEVATAIAKYSPYQNVRKDQKYPKILYETRTQDRNMDPAQSRRMALHMLELGHDVYFSENSSLDATHTGPQALPERIAQQAMEFTYFWNQLGVRN